MSLKLITLFVMTYLFADLKSLMYSCDGVKLPLLAIIA